MANLSANSFEIQVFKDGVAQMKALPSSDKRSWVHQASIHNDFCPHGNWWFLPWHRVYIQAFERIIRGLTGEPDWGLPYWNWQHVQSVPAIFTDSTSPLFDATRSSNNLNSTTFGAANVEAKMSESDFELFAGSAPNNLAPFNIRDAGTKGVLEQQLHDIVHGTVGGPSGHMRYTSTAALDPVFWSHHCMVDYQWHQWNDNRANSNISNSDWITMPIDGMFVDPDGNDINGTIEDVIPLPLYAYQYEPDTIGTVFGIRGTQRSGQLERLMVQGGPAKFRELDSTRIARDLVVGPDTPSTFSLDIPAAAFSAAMAPLQEGRIFLRLIDPKAPQVSDYFVRVFLGNPNANVDTPIDDASYAGSFGFFTAKDGKHHSGAYQVEISNALRSAGRVRGVSERVQLTFVPIPNGPASQTESDPLQLGSIDLILGSMAPLERS
uniref:tyrosinase family protein n=1 Tax=Parerythrobacter lutipelagi TaxID=1964208 RepID=UPI00137634D6|nr:tyrosinase family protein [Parerythrobacter lutipelagi]